MSALGTRRASCCAALVLGIVLSLMGEIALASAQRTFVAPPGVYAGVTSFDSTGITITGNFLQVVVRGLTINSPDVSTLAGRGVAVLSSNSRILVQRAFISGFAFGVFVADDALGNRLDIEDSTIHGCETGVLAVGGNAVMLDRVRLVGPNTGLGVQIHTASTHVRDSVIEGYDTGIKADGNSIALPLPLTVEGSTVRLNSNGIWINFTGSPASGGIVATVSNTIVSGNSGRGIDVACDSGAIGAVMIADSVVSKSGDAGIFASGGTCSVAVSHNVISGNAEASMVNVGGGSFVSFGDNRVYGNNPDTPSGTVTLVSSR